MALTVEQKEKVKELRLQGMGYQSIANELGVKRDQVRGYCRRNGMAGFIGLEHLKGKTIDCEQCGTKIEVVNPNQRFCSDKCRSKNYVKMNLKHITNCKFCNKTIKSYRGRSYCSDECRALHYSEIYTDYEKKERSEQERKHKAITKLATTIAKVTGRFRVCAHCNKEYILNRNGSTYKYCSDECREVLQREKARRRNRKNRIDKEKRWGMNGTPDYSISLEKLYKRDDGICHICGKKTDYEDYVTTREGHFIAGNNYPSIDHVIPISKGGSHRWNNVKLAHRRCNSIKGDKEIEFQMFLEV